MTLPAPVAPRARRRPTWSLRASLLFVLAAGALMAWQARRVRTQRDAVAAILRVGGTAYYDFQQVGEYSWNPGIAEPPRPGWLRSLPVELFQDVTRVDMRGGRAGDAEVAAIAGLGRVKDLDLSFSRVTDLGLSRLSGWTRLRNLGLNGTGVGDAGMATVARMSSLEDLWIGGTPVGNGGVDRLRALHNLRQIGVEAIPADPATVDELRASSPGVRIFAGGPGPR